METYHYIRKLLLSRRFRFLFSRFLYLIVRLDDLHFLIVKGSKAHLLENNLVRLFHPEKTDSRVDAS